jgi:hypothetical protein
VIDRCSFRNALFGAGATCYAPVPVPVVVRAVKGFSEIAWADLGGVNHVSWWGWRGADRLI